MKTIESDYQDSRQARRKIQNNITCRFDSNPTRFPVYELSSQGFSFLCPRDSCFFKRGAIFDKISVFNEEELEIITGSGTVVHTVEFGVDKTRIGVFFNKKTLDRGGQGKIRVPRHFPKVQINVRLTIKNHHDSLNIMGTLIDFTASTARIGFNRVNHYKFQIGEELLIKIDLEGTVLFEGPAYVLRKKDDRTEIIVHFSDQLLNISQVEATSVAFHNKDRILSTFKSFGKYQYINADFKALIGDWRLYLMRLKDILDSEEKKYDFRSDSERELFLQGIEKEILADLKNFVYLLNVIAEKVPKKDNLYYKMYFRESLVPIMRISPLAASIVDKDKGYSGDFETIKQFFQNPYSGDTLFAKMINKFLCVSDAVLAHKERIQFLYNQLGINYQNSDREFSFLVFGAGPAEEVIRFVKNRTFEKPVYATLLDMDAFALADFSERLQFFSRKNFELELININILNILRNEELNPIKRKYSFIYCAGMFDYFKKTICRRLVRLFIKHAEIGGKIVITNVYQNNTSRYFMDYGGGWEIIHRNNQEMAELIPDGFPVKYYFDSNKANIFVEIKIPDKSK